ncbi:hypothetical protein BT67DRAFT_441376 [Trichocladium antarcticum]|uniref:Uncharacterized protein n=1 Tax=Trichocladium antarcticum TaxID=1450529 RepID=A0AAN6UL60_9PEZI|nr:hypothetical protein BT67DRAFT_441376 [Trichocladium antarcticum]
MVKYDKATHLRCALCVFKGNTYVVSRIFARQYVVFQYAALWWVANSASPPHSILGEGKKGSSSAAGRFGRTGQTGLASPPDDTTAPLKTAATSRPPAETAARCTGQWILLCSPKTSDLYAAFLWPTAVIARINRPGKTPTSVPAQHEGVDLPSCRHDRSVI